MSETNPLGFLTDQLNSWREAGTFQRLRDLQSACTPISRFDGREVINLASVVRHKMLDAVGDLAMAGAPIHGRFIASRTGHALNNRLLRALLADGKAWRRVSLEQAGWSQPHFTAQAA